MSCDRKSYLIETVFPRATKSGRFGPGLEFVRCEKNNDGEMSVQFASSVVFVRVVLKDCTGDQNGQERVLRLVIKFLPESLQVRELMNSAVQFHNENVMYSEILPFLDYHDIVPTLFPEFYYGKSSDSEGEEPVVVVEDLRDKGFKVSNFKLFLDYNHVVVALKALGKFHALSYIAKQKRSEEFNIIKQKLKEHVWDRENASTGGVIGPCALRGVNGLFSDNKSSRLEKLIVELENNSLDLMKYFVEPEEPTAVICHGDFCNHNVLFKYDENTPDVPIAVKFFDLQTSRYASPVIDLSMILYLNTEYELRSRHWDEFIDVYHSSVSETVTDANCIPPTYDQLINDFRNKSFYGYFNCSYFLPMMVSDAPPPNMEECGKLEHSEMLKMLCNCGGDKGTQGLVSIVKHLDELNYFGFLDKFTNAN